MSPNTIGFVDREGASAWLNEPAAFGAKRPFIRASRSGEAKFYRYFNTYEFAGLFWMARQIAIIQNKTANLDRRHRSGSNGCARINCCRRPMHLFFAVGRGR